MLASVKSTTNVSLPSELKAKAIELNIPFSATLAEALTKRIEDLEQKGGKPKSAPGHPDALTTEADPC